MSAFTIVGGGTGLVDRFMCGRCDWDIFRRIFRHFSKKLKMTFCFCVTSIWLNTANVNFNYLSMCYNHIGSNSNGSLLSFEIDSLGLFAVFFSGRFSRVFSVFPFAHFPFVCLVIIFQAKNCRNRTKPTDKLFGRVRDESDQTPMALDKWWRESEKEQVKI